MVDFRQIIPVVTCGGREAIVEDVVKTSNLWQRFQKLRLTENMRVKKIIEADPERKEELLAHASWLLKIGDGKEDCIYQNIVKIPSHMVW